MTISFSLIVGIETYEFSRCGECGAVVVDSERHGHVAWHERLDAALQAAGAWSK